ncbi:hypothetical protein SAMN05660429_01397 [Thalassotalea agarivorans]|uniref:Uncharacterized protein n=1 Tax=Thalassotalea agarivorans TaxID=349064 RepID=A0A1I0D6P7_THASX|nr:hypothetical protein SAMN05660429_01397 [Thalassotalea agarivorans]
MNNVLSLSAYIRSQIFTNLLQRNHLKQRVNLVPKALLWYLAFLIKTSLLHIAVQTKEFGYDKYGYAQYQ